jgi:hypothetical protein
MVQINKTIANRCRLCQKGHLYKWPSEDDYSLEEQTNRARTMEHPTLVNNRQQF